MSLYRKKQVARFCSILMGGCLLAGSVVGCGNNGGMEGVSESLAGTGARGSVTGGPGTGDSGEEQFALSEGQSAYTFAGGIIVVSEMFTERDLSGGYDMAKAEELILSEGNVTITKEGVYVLRGALADGMVIVDADKDDKVQLVLDGVEIDNDVNAAIYVKQADKVFVTLAEGSVNSLTSRDYSSLDGVHIDGVIYARSDLVINGTGRLAVSAEQGHGIVSKDDLKITGGEITVAAEKQGLSGKDSVRIGGGTIQITSGKDGIHAENEEDTEKGYVYISDGVMEIISGGDGISAGSVVQVDGGKVDITAGGGSNNRKVAVDETGNAVSAKGIKATAELAVNQVVLSVDSQDDAIHSDLNVVINGGELSLATGDDGIHADEAAVITGGTIHISESYEGIEGNHVEISGGSIRLCATDDGLNAAGGNDRSGFGGLFGGDERFGHRGSGNREAGNGSWNPGSERDGSMEAGNGSWNPGSERDGSMEADNGDWQPGEGRWETEKEGSDTSHIWISGGLIYILAGGDGMDSNGDLLVSGGEVYVSGPENGANGAIDYERNGQITGGIVVAAGNSGMAMNFGNTSTQGSILVSTSHYPAGTVISLQNSEGEELVKYTAECAFNSVVVSSPEMVMGGMYTVVTGEESAEVTLSDSLIYGSGFGIGDFGNGGMPGGPPHMP